MRKPDSLRAALTAAFVDESGRRFLREPDRLLTFIDKGRLAIRHGEALGYEWRYRLRLVLLDFPAHLPDAVAAVMAVWLRDHQADLLQNHGRGDAAVSFEVDRIDDKTVDLELQVELSEAVRLVARPAGSFEVHYLPEPAVLDAPIGGALRELWLAGERIISSAD